MSNYFLAIAAGVIQGLTEFLPISSSGHLIIFHDLFNFNPPDQLLFDVILHLGTLAAVVGFFYRDIFKIIRGFLSSLVNWNWSNNYNQRLAWLVIIGTIPAVAAGFFLEPLITDYLRSTYVVVVMLIAVAILFWVVEAWAKKHRTIQQGRIIDALVIGAAQALALIPGTSRSGITMVAGLSRSFKREEAARFSFLLSAPIVLGAAAKKIISVEQWANVDGLILVVGFVASTLTGYFVIKFFLRYLSHHSLNLFAWYRVGLGVVLLVWLIWR